MKFKSLLVWDFVLIWNYNFVDILYNIFDYFVLEYFKDKNFWLKKMMNIKIFIWGVWCLFEKKNRKKNFHHFLSFFSMILNSTVKFVDIKVYYQIGPCISGRWHGQTHQCFTVHVSYCVKLRSQYIKFNVNFS
jgi:hypothetical protein